MPTLLETVVSNSLTAILLAVLAFAASRWRPALAHGLWLLVLVKLVTPPLIPVNVAAGNLDFRANATAQIGDKPERVPVSLDALSTDEIATLLTFSEEETEPASLATSSPPSEPAAPLNWQMGFVLLWLGGSLLWLGFTCGSVIRFRRLMRWAEPAPVGLQNEVRQLASRLGLARCPPVWIVPGAVSPMIWAVGAVPRLVFPSGLLNRLGVEQRAALLLHELAHVRRHDHWVRLMELAIGALYWWHPLFWLARRELREAEEQCCDAWVVWASGGEGRAYAGALLEAVAFVSHTRCPLPVAASGIGQVSHLRRRLTMIMRGNTPRSLSALGWLTVLTFGLCLLPLAARAQAPQKSDDDKEEVETLKEKLRVLEGVRDQKLGDDEPVELLVSVLDDEDADADAKATVAELKKMIAVKRAELNNLEAKLRATLGKLDATKASKASKEKNKSKDNPKGEIGLDLSTEAGAKQLAEQIEKAIRENPGLKQLEELKKLGKLQDLKQLEELKKLGDLHIEFKGLEDLKKQIGEVKGLDLKQLDELKKLKQRDFERASVGKGGAEKVTKEKARISDDMDARLDRLMKEIEQLRKEIHESKERQAR
jgi:beta-lactamase regulating signal transducer with metallopeptidase domain